MKDKTITELELEALFAVKKTKKTSLPKQIFQGVLFVLFSCIFIFIFINYPGLKANLIYWYQTEYKNELPGESTKQDQIVVTDKSKITGGEILDKMSDNHLKITAINVDAPIIWQVENTEDNIRKNLQDGIIHIEGTALPGEVGNVFVTGHSSDVPWSRGQYKTVLALLGKVSAGDSMAIKYHDKSYIYKINNIKIVEPTDLSVMDSSDQSILTVMTCTPVGTTLRRLVVTAKQIYPDPNKNTAPAKSNKPSKLPKTR